ncbi:MAG TPA: M15 family metallopeptidase [Clostridiales bacterium]|nr:M15 family metallopeptidase [Clostridiales bacterium]
MKFRFLLFYILISFVLIGLIVYIQKDNYIINEDDIKEDIIISDNNHNEMNADVGMDDVDSDDVVSDDVGSDDVESVFIYKPLTNDIIDKIMDSSYKTNDEIKIEDLSYVQVSYWGFDDKEYIGELIVNKMVAKDIVEIFSELYDAKFPIKKISLIDEYNADDNLSMSDNNTSAFNYRAIVGNEGKLSKHSYGLAIDINPVQNPYLKNGIILPKSGAEFLDRGKIEKGMIVEGDVCYNAFVNRGWTWGGEWNSVKDYQHFEK